MSAKQNVTSTQEVLQTVAWALKLGERPVALHPMSKAAISKDYVEPGYKPPPIEFWKSGDYGVGIALGKGTVDTDNDCPEARYFAKIFLPPTPARWGRPTAENSHYLYHIAGPLDTFKLTDPVSHDVIVEVRSTGHQTVLPGSIHPDTKDLISWAEHLFPDIASAELEQYVRAVRKIAIATLIARHIFAPGSRNDTNMHLAGMFFYLEWTVEEAWQLVDAVFKYIGDTDKTREKTFFKTYEKGEQGKKITGATRLRKELPDKEVVVDRILEWAGNATVNVVQEYNERYAVGNLNGKFRIAYTDVKPGTPPHFFTKEDFFNLKGRDYVTLPDGTQIQKARLWLRDARCREFSYVEFVPGVEDLPDKGLNMWTGWAVQPKKGKPTAFLELVEVVCGDDSRWTLNWFAHCLRDPAKRPMTALVVIGKQGAGKSFMLRYFGRILGSPGYTVVTNEEHIHGRFNYHLGHCILLHSEEATYGGDNKHKGILKSLITDDKRIFEMKGIDAHQVDNYLRLVITSNSLGAAAMEAGDRRYSVVDAGDRKISAELAKRVEVELNADGPAHLFYYLTEEFDYDPELVSQPLRNKASSVMANIHFDPIPGWWHDTLTSGQLLASCVNWAQKPLKEDWPQWVGTSALYLSMVLFLRERGIRRTPTRMEFDTTLQRLLGGAPFIKRQVRFLNPFPGMDGEYNHWPREAKSMNDRQQTIINFPDLTAARKAFVVETGQPVDWPGVEFEDAEPPPPRGPGY